MTVRVPISFRLAERDIAFVMAAEPGNIADHNTMACVQSQGCCEPEIVHVMARALRPGDCAIDVGANVGFFTLTMGKLVGPTGSVTAFEPTPGAFLKLRENVKANALTHVSCMQQALWNKAEQVTLHMSEDSGFNALARTPKSIGTLKLDATTLDAAMSAKRCRLIKMDAEGAEANILCGASWVTPVSVPYVVSEFNDEALARFGSSGHALRVLMDVRGYDTFIPHKDGSFPTLIPRQVSLDQGQLQNVNVLFSTLERVSALWQQVKL